MENKQVTAFTTKRELQVYSRRRLNTFSCPLVYTRGAFADHHDPGANRDRVGNLAAEPLLRAARRERGAANDPMERAPRRDGSKRVLGPVGGVRI
jgi:hypothetical protein